MGRCRLLGEVACKLLEEEVACRLLEEEEVVRNGDQRLRSSCLMIRGGL